MNKLKQATLHNAWFIILSTISVGLIITSFIVPPLGVIDPSVIAASGELLGWGALWTVWRALNAGHKTTIKHNNTDITIGGH